MINIKTIVETMEINAILVNKATKNPFKARDILWINSAKPVKLGNNFSSSLKRKKKETVPTTATKNQGRTAFTILLLLFLCLLVLYWYCDFFLLTIIAPLMISKVGGKSREIPNFYIKTPRESKKLCDLFYTFDTNFLLFLLTLIQRLYWALICIQQKSYYPMSMSMMKNLRSDPTEDDDIMPPLWYP